MGGGADDRLDRPKQEDEQGLREVVCEWRSVRICCHDPTHGEGDRPRLRTFHTVSLGCEYPKEWLWATSWTGLTLLLGEPKVPCKCLVDWTPWCRPTAARGRSRT